MTALASAPAAQHGRPVYRRQGNRGVPYLPGLDGLRALAVVAVLVYHANHAWLGGGFLGVEVFFVISGYLITLLIITEHERTRKVDLKAFWIRRFRRLLPALFVLLLSLSLYMSMFERRPLGNTRGDIVAGLLYGSNWYQLWAGQGYTNFEAFAPLRHLWSLAVEEQFYLVWPLVMVALLSRGRKHLPRVGVWLVALSVAIAAGVGVLFVGGDIESECASSMRGYWRILGRCVNINETLYLSTVARAGGLMLGAGFAMFWRPQTILRSKLRYRGALLDKLAAIALGGLLLLMSMTSLTEPAKDSLFGIRYDPVVFRGGFLLVGVLTLCTIAAATHRDSQVGRLLGMRPLRWIGTRSYGLYLFHWPVYQIIREPGQQLSVTQAILAAAITLPITELSFRLVETPIRKQGAINDANRRRRSTGWTASRVRPAPPPVRNVLITLGVTFAVGFAGLNVATAEMLCVGEVACSLDGAAGDEADVVDGLTDVTVPVATTTTIAALPVPLFGNPDATSTTSTTEPVLAGTVYAVGESVMLGAKNALEAGGIVVDAEKSRQGTAIAEIVESMRAKGLIEDVIVIQTGTNGPVSKDTFDRIMKVLPAATTPLVVFLTVRAPRSWIEPNNEIIRALPDEYSNVRVLDWAVESDAIESELSRSDGGIHLATRAAMQFYANLIFDAIERPELKVE
ncbi:MAG: acyltransferase family protein [Ilumatobacteraceae bacterium]